MSVFKAPPAWLTFSIAGAAVVAISPLPYGYYQLLRLVVTGYAAYLAWQYFQHDVKKWSWAFTFLAILYNPIFVISMSKEFHSLVNLATAGLILWDCRVNLTAHQSDPNNEPNDANQATEPYEKPLKTNTVDAGKSKLAFRLLAAALILIPAVVAARIIYMSYEHEEMSEAEAEQDEPSETPVAETDDFGSASATTSDGLPPNPAQSSDENMATGEDGSVRPDDLPLPAISIVTPGRVQNQSDWRGEEGVCRLVVFSKKYIEGKCWVRLNADGSFQIMSQDESYFAQLQRGGGAAMGYWNGTPGSTHAQSTLGAMYRSGACWKNINAEICAWSR